MITTIQRLFLFILIFAPLSFGARAEWSFLIVSACVFAAFLLLVRMIRKNQEAWHQVPGMLPLVCLLLYIFIQLVPLPVWLVSILSPGTAALYKQTLGIIEPVEWISLSIHKRATVMEFFRYSTYVVFYMLTVQLFTRKETLKNTLKSVALLSGIIAIAAILQYFISPDKIYGFRSVPENATPFGPYIYHNHYAGFMEMVFPLTLVLFLYYRPLVAYGNFRYRMIEFFNDPKTNRHLLFGFFTLIIGVSIFLSYSRGGIISLCLSLCFMAILLASFRKRLIGKHRRVFPVIILLIFFSVGWFGWDFIFERFESIRSADGVIENNRLVLWKDTMQIIRQFPLTGSGFGTFADIYPEYRSLPGQIIYHHAHNDYLEFLVNGGLIGTVFFIWFLFSVGIRAFRIVRKRRDPYAMYLFVASLTGILSIAIHSGMDFNLQNGANGLYFSFLLGLLVSGVHTRFRIKGNGSYLALKNNVRWKRTIIPSTIALLLTIVFHAGCVAGKFHFSGIQNVYIDETVSADELQQLLSIAQKASEFDPLNSQYYFGIGNLQYFLRDTEQARKSYLAAIHCNPAKGEYLQRLGLVLEQEGNHEKSVGLMAAGIQRDPSNPVVHTKNAAWLYSQGRLQESSVSLRKAIDLDPSRQNLYERLEYMEKIGAGPGFMKSAMPPHAGAYLYFAEYLLKKKVMQYMDSIYRKATSLLERQQNLESWYFFKICNYYLAAGKDDEALRVMRLGREKLSENPWIRIKSGDVYKKVGIFYRAVEEYQKALSIDPVNGTAKKKLRRLERG